MKKSDEIALCVFWFFYGIMIFTSMEIILFLSVDSKSLVAWIVSVFFVLFSSIFLARGDE